MQNASFAPTFRITNRITAGLTHIERARGFLEAATLSENWVREMGNRALVLEAYHTTHIEGTRLTLDQAERLWQGDSVPEADPDDALELLNYRKAFDFVSEYLKSGDPITEGLVREIHKRLVEGVRGEAAAPGEYRRIQNYVVNSVTGETIYRVALPSSNLCTSIHSWTATAAPPGCSPHFAFIGPDTISNGFLLSVNTMTGIAPHSTG